MPEEDPQAYLRTIIDTIYRALKPGGWLDLCEFPMKFYSDDNTLENSEMDRWYKLVKKGTEKTGTTPSPPKPLHKY